MSCFKVEVLTKNLLLTQGANFAKIAKNKVLSGFGDGIGKETGICRQKTKKYFCLVREVKSEQPGVGWKLKKD